MKRTPRTYKEWDQVRSSGRAGKKKIRRDTTLFKRPDGTLVFMYGSEEVLATLTPDDTYTLTKHESRYNQPTYSNLFALIAGVTTYNDTSHYKHYAVQYRVNINGKARWERNKNGKWGRAKSAPFTNGLQFRHGECLNPEIAVDYKRTLNRTKSLPWLRKTEVLAKVLRVATRMRVLERDRIKRVDDSFENINIEDPTANDAEIILCRGNAMGLYRSWNTDEQKHAALLRCAENGLADYREWLYKKHGCYEMLPVETKGDQQ